MRTKKDIQFLLESGLSSSFLSKLNDSQTKSLVERFNKKETNEVTMVSSTDSATQSKLQSEKKPYEVYEKTEMDEDSTFNIVKDPAASEDGMETTESELKEKFESQSQQNFFWAKCNTSKGVKKNKWCELAREFSDSTSKKQYKTMPKKKNPEKMDESYEKFLEDKIVGMIERRIEPKMTKGDILKTISEKMEKNNSMMLRNPKKMSMFSHESGIEGKRMKRPNQMMPIMGAMEENDTKEKERTKEKDAPTKPGTPPKRRGNPFKDPNPGVKEAPRGEKKNKEKMKQDFIGLIKQVFQ
tara:strand:+ start:7335 stop:8228 length:894 start_codon:yes stop_codon:yes gene_type:complete